MYVGLLGFGISSRHELPSSSFAMMPSLTKFSAIYKTVDGQAIDTDVYLPETTPDSKPHPISM
jgi:hypothetical protein